MQHQYCFSGILSLKSPTSWSSLLFPEVILTFSYHEVVFYWKVDYPQDLSNPIFVTLLTEFQNKLRTNGEVIKKCRLQYSVSYPFSPSGINVP